MLEFLISLVVFLLILTGIWYGLTTTTFGKKHFCYKNGKSLYDCGKDIKVCTTKDSNAQNVCSTINRDYKENFN